MGEDGKRTGTDLFRKGNTVRQTRRFNRVAVFKGGISGEREVSLRSGAAVGEGLRRAGYTVVEIDVRDRNPVVPAECEAVFIALHGEFGEDGELQGLLRRRGIPYTGSGPAASRKAFDKRLTKETMVEGNIPTARYEIISVNQSRTLPLPVVTKPLREGSSIGISRVFCEEEWDEAMQLALSHGSEVLVEAYHEGRECTVGILGENTLPVVEIVPAEGYYDYEAKYIRDTTRYIVPADIAADCAGRAQGLSMKLFNSLGCNGFARVDFILCADGSLVFLELNSIPGFTPSSLLPKAARAAGIEFPDLCKRIMETADL